VVSPAHVGVFSCRCRIKEAEEAEKEEKQKALAQVDALIETQKQAIQIQKDSSERTLGFLEKYLERSEKAEEKKADEKKAAAAAARDKVCAPLLTFAYLVRHLIECSLRTPS
jgi:hypothetical protein